MVNTTERRAFLTVKEAAVVLRLAPSTVYRLTRAGIVESVRVGGSVRIPARALDPEKEKR